MSLTPKKIKSRCCQSGCSDCPWGFKSDPELPQELREVKESSCDSKNEDLQALAEKYLEQYLQDTEEKDGC